MVEADPDLQHRFARRLTVAGNRVVGTSSGEGALALASHWAVDLAFVAEDLPAMEGLEVVRRLAKLVPHARIVLLVSDDGPDVSAAAILAGATACVRKPRRGDRLIEIAARLDAEAEAAERALTQVAGAAE